MEINHKIKDQITGFIAANSLVLIVMAITKYFLPPFGGGNVIIFSEFVILPFLMGIVSAWCWRKINISTRKQSAWTIYNTVIAIVLSFLVLKEGMICLVIVSPLLFAFILLGTYAGKAMFKRNNQTLNASVFVMLFGIFIADSLSVHRYENKVADTITVNAPPTEVWKYVVAYKRIEKKSDFWLFRMGMPSPVQSTAEGYYLGAKRKCIFSNGYVFDEKIVTYDENKDLTFDITNQPRDPEIMGHIDILRGQFLLKDNGNGTTRLTGNSWYRLYVFPVWYYDIWAESVTRNVHLRVMEHIKELAEAK
ncbi:SRPBCC family protein [Mucilaginibacter phyllosphaerae]